MLRTESCKISQDLADLILLLQERFLLDIALAFFLAFLQKQEQEQEKSCSCGKPYLSQSSEDSFGRLLYTFAAIKFLVT